MFVAILREVHRAREQMRPVTQVRVTTDALEGTIAAAPVTPERARVLGKLRATPVGVISDPPNERLLEILIHPEDWKQLLMRTDSHGAIGFSDGVETALGLPVSYV